MAQGGWRWRYGPREQAGSYHVRAVAGGFVRGGLGLAGQGRGGTGGVNTFLFLPAVAEPDADHLLLHVELFSDEQDLL